MTKTSKWRFSDGEIWGFDDLVDKEKQIALDAGCEPGKKYHGSPDDYENEVPQCPICGHAFMYYKDVSCEHMVFVWDDENGEYSDTDPDFFNYFWQIVYPKIRHGLSPDGVEQFEDLRKDSKLPYYYDWVNFVPDLAYFQIDHVFFNPTIWGFANSKLLREIQEIKSFGAGDK